LRLKKSVSRETPRYEYALWSLSSCCAISCACVYRLLGSIVNKI